MELSNSPSWQLYCRSLIPELSHLLRNRVCLFLCHKSPYEFKWTQPTSSHHIFEDLIYARAFQPVSSLKLFRLKPCLISNICDAYSTQITLLDYFEDKMFRAERRTYTAPSLCIRLHKPTVIVHWVTFCSRVQISARRLIILIGLFMVYFCHPRNIPRRCLASYAATLFPINHSQITCHSVLHNLSYWQRR
jgi:hypothetical protein